MTAKQEQPVVADTTVGWNREEMANHGTLFLDEIGDMHHELQTKLLRFLQEKEIDKVGGGKPIKLDVRVIAATN